MLKNYFKIALRNLRKHPGYTFINVFGLATGITCFVLILLYVQDELAYDRYHENADRIHRVVEVIEDAEESSSQPFPTGPTLAADFPHLIEASVRFFNLQAPSLAISYEPPSGEVRSFNERSFFFADSTVFDIFSFDLVRGDPATALDRPGTVVLTEDAAQRYFGDDDPLGKSLIFEDEHLLEVTGVLAEVPRTSHFTFDFLASFSTLRASIYADQPRRLEGWYWNPAWTYVLLEEGVTPEDLEAQFPEFVQQYWPEQIKAQSSMYLQPLTDIHLHSKLDFEITGNSDIAYVYIFSVIAAFILLIACINFMNLATARSASRAKEVGMRKVLGAVRLQLVRQFLAESVLLSVVALLLALPLIYLLLPVLNDMADKTLSLSLSENSGLIWLLAAVALGVGVVSGLYPALFLSSYRPARVLKGAMRTSTTSSSALFRKGLVVVQFAVSIALIAGTFVAIQQLDYLRDARLGFDRDQVVMVPILRTSVASQYDAVKDALLQQPGVRAVTIAEDVLGARYQTQTQQPEGFTEPQQFLRLFVHDDAAETFGIRLLAGRDYDEAYADDGAAIVINEAMVQYLGWGSPEEALGRSMGTFGPDNVPRPVIGVTENFHYASLHQPVGPFILPRISNNLGAMNFFGRYLAIRISPDDVAGALAAIEATWTSFVPDRPFEYLFVDQELDQLYRAEENLSNVAGTFSILAILIGCLGLFGLAAFTAERRTKEIGVRKVLGATVPGIVALLSKDFVTLVLVAFFIAAPLSYLAINRWLADFAYSVNVSWWIFLLSGALALGVALLTVSYQAIKAALADPVKSLRYE